MEGTLIVEADSNLDDLGRRLEAVVYSNGADRRDVLVVCRAADRPVVEPFVFTRYRPVELLSVASPENDVLTEHVLRRVRTERFAFLKVGSEFAEPDWEHKAGSSNLSAATSS